jgi:hypothetical protein
MVSDFSVVWQFSRAEQLFCFLLQIKLYAQLTICIFSGSLSRKAKFDIFAAARRTSKNPVQKKAEAQTSETLAVSPEPLFSAKFIHFQNIHLSVFRIWNHA